MPSELYALQMSKNTWNRGSYTSPAICWVRLASSVAIPISRLTLNLCRKLCKTTPCFNRQFTTAAHTFHETSTITIPRYPPFPFGMRTIVAHASYAIGVPSPNVLCANIAKSSHCLLTGSFLRVASHR